jgi:hypothetical protein
MNVKKIREMLRQKYREILAGQSVTPRSRANAEDDLWLYLNGLDCTVLDSGEIHDDFEDIVNYSVQGRVCVRLPLRMGEVNYILMPKELAQKVVVLGGLPDHWSPENQTL